MKNKFYVYLYLDPRKEGMFNYGDYQFTYEPFYVGKGTGNRCLHHLHRKSEKKYNPLKGYKISKIQREFKKDPIIIKVEDNISSKNAFLLEEYLISTIGRIDKKEGPLTNLTNGGDGVSGVSEETKEKLRSWKRTEEYRKRISETLKGRKIPSEVIEKCRQTKIKNGTTGKGIAQTVKKFVIVTPSNGVIYIKNLKDFCRKDDNLTYNLMRAVVDGNRPHHKGYKVSKILTEDEIDRMKGVKIKRNTVGYKIISPTGKKYIINNLKEFCKEHKLMRSNMCSAYRNNKKYKGWKCSSLY